MNVAYGANYRFRVMLLAVLVALSALLVFPSRFAMAASADDQMSLYNTASGAAVYLDMMMHSGNAADDKDHNGTNMANAEGIPTANVARISGALGYSDLDAINTETMDKKVSSDEPGWTTFISADNSRNAVIYSYDAFSNKKSYGQVGEAIAAYGHYGHLLDAIGVDEVIMSDGIPSPARPIIGNTMQGLFFLSNGADQIMSGIVKAMQFTNPFRLFGNFENGEWKDEHDVADGVEATGSKTATWNRSTSDFNMTIEEEEFKENENKPSSIFEVPGVGVIAEFLFTVYRGLYGISTFILIPLTVAITIAGYMLGRSGFGQNSALAPKLKRYAIRMAFLVGGIPLLGMAYTATLDRLATDGLWGPETGMYQYDLSDVVLHSFVDFGSWAENTNLAVPDGVTFSIGEDGEPTNATHSDVASIAYAINKAGHTDISDVFAGSGSSSGDRSSSSGDKNYANGYWIDKLDDDDKVSDEVGEQKVRLVNNLLSSYAKGEVLSGADFETGINAKVMEGQDGKRVAEVYQFLRACADPETYADGLMNIAGAEGEEANLKIHGILQGNEVDYVASAKTQEELSELYERLRTAAGTDDEEALIQEIRDVIEKEQEAHESEGSPDPIKMSDHYFGNGTLKGTLISKGKRAGQTKYTSGEVGLSDVGMYNYLNTKFGSTSLAVYSGKNSVTTQSHPSHYRVNLAGGIALGPFMAANAGLLMLAVSVTGILYGLGLLFAAIKRSFSLMLSLPMAFTGAIRSIAHVLLLGLALICEIFGTIFAYMLMKSLLISVNEFISTGQVADWFISLLSNFGEVGGVVAAIINYLVACVFLLAYILLAIRVRTAITNAITDLVASLLSRLTDVNPGDVTSSSTSFIDRMIPGMMSNPVASVATAGALGVAGSAALSNIGQGSVDEIAMGGNGADGSINVSGGDGADGEAGLSGSGNMLTGAYASEGGIEGGGRQNGDYLLGAVVGGDAFADAASGSDAYGASARSGDALGGDSLSMATGGDAEGGASGEDGSQGETGLAEAYSSSFGEGGNGGTGGESSTRDAVRGESALAEAAAGGDAYANLSDGTTNISGAQLSSAAYGGDGGTSSATGGHSEGGVGGSAEGGDGNANANGASLSSAAYGGDGKSSSSSVSGSNASGGSADASAEGGDGTVNVRGASVLAQALAEGGDGGEGRFRDSGGEYDRDMASDANVRVDSRADGLRNVQVASLASTLAGAPGGDGGDGSTSNVRGVSANVDLGASTNRFGTGTLAPNAAPAGSQDRVREVHGQSVAKPLASSLHAESATIGSANSEHTSGGDVRSNGSVSANDRIRGVKGESASLSASLPGGAHGGSGTPGTPGAPGRGGNVEGAVRGVDGGSSVHSDGTGGSIEGGQRGPKVSMNTGPAHIGGAPLSAATNGQRGVRPGQSAVPSSSRRGSRSASNGQAVSPRHGTEVVGLGEGASPHTSSRGRGHGGSEERFKRAMNGSNSTSKTKRGDSGTSLGDAVRGGKPSHGVDVDTIGNRDPLGRK